MLVVSIMTSTLTTRIKKQEQLHMESEKEKMRANLLRAVSHDLRTPLTSIYGACSTVIENYDSLDKEKTIKLLDLDCGHCADKIQNAVKKIDGVTSVSVNFLGQKMVLEAPDDQFDTVLAEAKTLIKQIEPDVTVKA